MSKAKKHERRDCIGESTEEEQLDSDYCGKCGAAACRALATTCAKQRRVLKLESLLEVDRGPQFARIEARVQLLLL